MIAPIHPTTHHQRTQYLVLGLVSIGAIGCTAIVSRFPGTPFQPYLGTINPLVAIIGVVLVGGAALVLLDTRRWFAIFAMGRSRRGLAAAVSIATAFGIIVVAADFLIRFPRTLNVPSPQALFFYPAIGYVVEVVFHAVPLALVLGLGNRLWKPENAAGLLWFGLVLAAALEPVLQVRAGSSGWVLSESQAFVGLHVLAFNALQLYVFRRYDFVSMYAMRLVYYLYWHIIWGYLRLRWLY